VPLPALVVVSLAAVGAVLYVANSVRELRRQKRNLRHWEKDEPLEDTGDWD
jgi:hypothetical protein